METDLVTKFSTTTNKPHQLLMDPNGPTLYYTALTMISRMDITTKVVTTVAGTEAAGNAVGSLLETRFESVSRMALSDDGLLLAVDTSSKR